MNSFFRATAFALVSLAVVPAAAPAYAGPNEQAFLAKHIGTWRGTGQMTGSESGTVACRLTFKGSGARLTFSGRCTYSGGGGGGSVSGVIAYNDKTKRYESSGAGEELVVGKKSGNSVTFTSTGKDMRGTATSSFTLSGNRISVDFSIVDRKGGKSQGRIPFTKG